MLHERVETAKQDFRKKDLRMRVDWFKRKGISLKNMPFNSRKTKNVPQKLSSCLNSGQRKEL
jgi:hypothetical protein